MEDLLENNITFFVLIDSLMIIITSIFEIFFIASLSARFKFYVPLR